MNRMNIDVRVKTFFLILVKTKFDQQIPTKKKALCSGSLEFFFYPTIFSLGEDLTAAVQQMSRLFPLSSRADSKERLFSSLVHFGFPG